MSPVVQGLVVAVGGSALFGCYLLGGWILTRRTSTPPVGSTVTEQRGPDLVTDLVVLGLLMLWLVAAAAFLVVI